MSSASRSVMQRLNVDLTTLALVRQQVIPQEKKKWLDAMSTDYLTPFLQASFRRRLAWFFLGK